MHDETLWATDNVRTRALNDFQVALVGDGTKDDFDILKHRLCECGPLRARPHVCYNWLLQRWHTCQAFGEDSLDVGFKPPDIEQIKKCLDKLPEAIWEEGPS